MMASDRFMTLSDVADVLNISVRHANTLVRTGELAGIKVGGRGVWRVERSKLEEYIAEAYQRTADSVAHETLSETAEADRG